MYHAVNVLRLCYKNQSVIAICSEFRAKHTGIINLWKRKEMAVTARVCTAVLDVTAAMCTAKNAECVSERRLCMDLPFWEGDRGGTVVKVLRYK